MRKLQFFQTTYHNQKYYLFMHFIEILFVPFSLLSDNQFQASYSNHSGKFVLYCCNLSMRTYFCVVSLNTILPIRFIERQHHCCHGPINDTFLKSLPIIKAGKMG